MSQSLSAIQNPRERQLRQACAEVARRVRDGQLEVVESLFAATPDLAREEDMAIELIYTEFVTREEHGETPELAEYRRRFPAWGERIERLFRLHDAMTDEEDRPRASRAGLETASGRRRESTLTPHRGDGDTPTRHRIGGYEIIEEIGRGGMGIVYKCQQTTLNRIVAVKVVRSASASSVERARFRAEAEATARLQHPNIVHVLEVGQQDDDDFLSMEYVGGGSLDRRIGDGQFAPRAAAELVAILADAMQYAHEQGIVHRDLKPANVLLMPGGAPKITDFGLAKQMTRESLKHTQTGAILGTPCYMAPEQAAARHGDVGPATDVYALGAILYELLTGQPPFQGATPLETLDQIRGREPVAPARINPKTPRDLEVICLTCLEKDLRRRYPSAKALAEDLRRFLEYVPIQARRIGLIARSWRRVRRHLLVSSLVLALLLVSGVGAGVFAWQYQLVDELKNESARFLRDNMDIRSNASRAHQVASVANEKAREAEKKAQDAEKQAKDAEKQAKDAEQQVNNLVHRAEEAIFSATKLGELISEEPRLSDKGRQVLDDLLAHYEGLLQLRSDDPRVRHNLARLRHRLGVLQVNLGQWDVSEANLMRGIELLDSVEGKIEEIQRKSDLSSMQRDLGYLLHRTERWRASEAAYRRAIELLQQLREKQPDQPAWAMGQANAMLNLCVGLIQEGRTDEALRVYTRVMRLQRTTLQLTLQVPIASVSFEDPVAESGDIKEILREEVLLVQAFREDLARNHRPRLPEFAQNGSFSELALSLDDAGIALHWTGEREISLLACEEGKAIRDIVYRQNSTAPGNAYFLARSHLHMGMMSDARAEYDASRTSYEHAIQLYEELARRFSTRIDYRNMLTNAYDILGRSRYQAGERTEARQWLLKAVQHREKLSKEVDVGYMHSSLANSLLLLGKVSFELGEYSEAMSYFRRAAAVKPDVGGLMDNLASAMNRAEELLRAPPNPNSGAEVRQLRP